MIKDRIKQILNINDVCVFSTKNYQIEIVKITEILQHDFGNFIYVDRIVGNNLHKWKNRRIYIENSFCEQLIKINNKLDTEITLFQLKGE